jgi:hypothetical protein
MTSEYVSGSLVQILSRIDGRRARPYRGRHRGAGVSMSDWWFPLLIGCGLAAVVVSAAALLMWCVR